MKWIAMGIIAFVLGLSGCGATTTTTTNSLPPHASQELQKVEHQEALVRLQMKRQIEKLRTEELLAQSRQKELSSQAAARQQNEEIHAEAGEDRHAGLVEACKHAMETTRQCQEIYEGASWSY